MQAGPPRPRAPLARRGSTGVECRRRRQAPGLPFAKPRPEPQPSRGLVPAAASAAGAYRVRTSPLSPSCRWQRTRTYHALPARDPIASAGMSSRSHPALTVQRAGTGLNSVTQPVPPRPWRGVHLSCTAWRRPLPMPSSWRGRRCPDRRIPSRLPSRLNCGGGGNKGVEARGGGSPTVDARNSYDRVGPCNVIGRRPLPGGAWCLSRRQGRPLWPRRVKVRCDVLGCGAQADIVPPPAGRVGGSPDQRARRIKPLHPRRSCRSTASHTIYERDSGHSLTGFRQGRGRGIPARWDDHAAWCNPGRVRLFRQARVDVNKVRHA